MSETQKRLLGFLNRKERWGVSWHGWIAALLLAVLAGWLLVRNVYLFLSPTSRVETKILVVEGWVHEFAIRAAATEFQNGGYDRIYTTGGPVVGLGHYVNDYQTSASVGAGRLKAAGVPADSVQMVASKIIGRDRTYHAAIALRDWFRDHGVLVAGINVVTEDVHARRTRLLYQKAFGDGIKGGIIAVPNPDYDPKRWWQSSEGVRDVLGETVAWVYARFFFWPAAPH